MYKDIDFLLTKNALTNFLDVKTDHDAVSQTLKNMVLTGIGEKLFSPGFGSGIEDLLFEIPSNLLLIEKAIYLRAVLDTEKRATITDLKITKSKDETEVTITITYYLSNENPNSILTTLTINL